MNQREKIKEQWGKFTDSHKPFLSLGTLLADIRIRRLYREWGHENIQDYLEKELHLPFGLYGLYVKADKQAGRLSLSMMDRGDVERGYGVKEFLRAAAPSKTKDELFQRLGGEYHQSSTPKRRTIGPFVLTHKELHTLWALGGFRGKPEEFSKEDLLRIAEQLTKTFKKEELC